MAVFRWIAIAALLGCNRLPVWTGTVHVTPRAREAVATCGTGELTTEGATYISRSPYLQSTTSSSTFVVWGATGAAGDVIVREPDGGVVATVPGAYAGDADRRDARLAAQLQPGKELAANDIYLLEAAVTGLAAGHLYCYQVLVGGAAMTEPAPFATAAPPGGKDPVRFVALGDSGTGGAAESAIAQRISAVAFDLMLFLGDIAYQDGTAQQLQSNFFAVYRDFLRYVPAYPSLGNHERHTRLGRPYLEAFVLPEPERYYSFDWGDVHFVAIDTTQRDAKQLVWLDEDLTKNRLPWVIVYGHHPMYTNSLRGAQLWVRKAFAKIVTQHHVDLVLTGHEHQYERFRIADVNYVVSGGGGGRLTRFYGEKLALKQATVHHFLAFEVTAQSLVMKAIDIEGNEIETLRLVKQGGRNRVEVDAKPDPRSNAVPPETQTIPDEKIHHEPDDDVQRPKAE